MKHAFTSPGDPDCSHRSHLVCRACQKIFCERCGIELAEATFHWKTLGYFCDDCVRSGRAERPPRPSQEVRRDPKLVALLDAARELAEVADSPPHFRSNALDHLVTVALAWAAEECSTCGRRGDHEWDELTDRERLAHYAEGMAQGI